MPLIQGRRHACDNAFSPDWPERDMAAPHAFLRHSAGWIASGGYCAARKPNVFGKVNQAASFPARYRVRALRKLRQLDAAATIKDLRNPPGNRLDC